MSADVDLWVIGAVGGGSDEGQSIMYRAKGRRKGSMGETAEKMVHPILLFRATLA